MTDERNVPQDDDTQPIDSSFFSPGAPTAQRVDVGELDRPAEPPGDARALVRALELAGRPRSAGATVPAPSWQQPAQQPAAGGRSGSGIGTIVAAALLAAVLASGGTVAALTATGAFDRPASTTAVEREQRPRSRQPVTIDESSAVIDVATKAGPSVVRIVDRGRRPERHRTRPEQGRRLRDHLRPERLDPHEPPRRRRQRTSSPSSSRTGRSTPARSTASTR